jgi:hypothetical protein
MINKIKQIITKQETLLILVSLLITSFISAIVGIGVLLWLGTFWGGFFTAFAAQIVIFAVINSFLIRKDQIKYTELLNQQLEAASKYAIQLSCAYCKQPNTTPIVLNQENRFKCEYCGQISSIKMQFYAAQITIPLEKVILPSNESDSAVIFKVSEKS